MSSRAQRSITGLLAVAALVVASWFALGVLQAHNLDRASTILAGPGPLSAAAKRDVASELATAGTLNPDREVDLLRAELAVARSERGEAVRILEQVTHSEPDYATAWLALASTADNAAISGRALRQIARLVPPVSRH
jgi:predicted Zn-dependent protease